jgi:GDPmannose 4,6-dehydratase
VGDPAKAREVLGWSPEYTFSELVAEMVQSDIDNIRRLTPQADVALAT